MENDSKYDLIYPWNTQDHNRQCQNKELAANLQQVELNDETLRDGLQSPSVRTPSLDEKIKILHYMEKLGIHSVDLGIPAAGATVKFDVLHLAVEAMHNKMKLQLGCAGRTIISDLEPIVEISHQIGVPIEAGTFIGSSMIRQYAESWNLEGMLKKTKEAVKFAVDNNLEVMYVTEDTTRTDPRIVEQLYLTAIEAGARRICLCDTVGYATPAGVTNLIKFVKGFLKDTKEEIKIDWHGHNDRGLGLANTLAAIRGGVNRVQGTCLGIGERSGNTSIDQLLINLFLLGKKDIHLHSLGAYCEYVSSVCDTPIPNNYPAIGRDAFRTATGVHAAAIIKALKTKKDKWLADYVYSAVPASELGLQQKIDIGPVSGKSNVVFWLEQRGIEPTEKQVEIIFQYAKQAKHTLTENEVYALIDMKSDFNASAILKDITETA